MKCKISSNNSLATIDAGNLYNPVHSAGNAIDSNFIIFANLRLLPIVLFSYKGHSNPLFVYKGPTAWITFLQGKVPPEVATTLAVGIGLPNFFRIMLDSS